MYVILSKFWTAYLTAGHGVPEGKQPALASASAVHLFVLANVSG